MNLTQKREKRTAQYYIETLNSNTTLDMVLVPSGSFLMGSPDDEPERSPDESPQHSVIVPAFSMARYPITQQQWRVVAALPEVDRPLEPDPSHFKGDNRPVEGVSWHDATEFCDRLTQATRRPYRLPSEAECEYACRAGTTTPFYFGNTIIPELANYDGNSTYNDGSQGEYRGETTPVDHFGTANAFGLCDMHGNVWEWCQDNRHENYEGAPVDGSTWVNLEAAENASCVLRSGGWDFDPRSCRSATRGSYVAGERGVNVGFRVVCVASRT